MADDVAEEVGSSAANSDLPFRMSEMKLIKEIPAHIPLADTMNTVQKEWLFQWKLLRNDWTRSHYTTVLFGFLALIFGSVSSELINGGDAKVSGLDGVLAINGFQFFQVMVSLICWGWFAYQAWMLFPVMRIHAISLLVMWNGLVGAQIFFHQKNPTFPVGLNLSDMMQGTLVVLVVFFFLFFFWKAVVETRDLHVEINHLHEDVRVMEEALADHSLRGWSAVFATWVMLVVISSWAGLHHVASYGESNIGFLVVHLLTGLPAIPVLMFVLWYPQRMLGNQAQVRTRAAVDASLEMSGVVPAMRKTSAACPECGASSPLSLNSTGELEHPCIGPGCSALVVVGNSCYACTTPMPSRIDCPSCGVNAPALDYMPDQEAW